REMEQFGNLLAIFLNLGNDVYSKKISNGIKGLGQSLNLFVEDLFSLRKEYRGIRKGAAIPIADTKRMCVLEDFIKVLESASQSIELISTLQSILGV
ncbi:MAG: hypothetical protein M8350_05120, partial [Methanosarcinaceae archaeon]|nr:hypothetical protein [Methanosarcinaceae archaeon]